ncbi:MAG: hypothetical protein BWY89_01578 [Bacteroidetes bacterium ADurb.BinA012]|nr:MAG: hypothetical protein BWY89_01578 [Bacteroidetes bacterium ADurb.BinA012]
MVKGRSSFAPLRSIFRSTLVPRGPFNILTTSSSGMFLPAMSESLTMIILSPGIMPAFSEGPPDIVLIISTVSVSMLNETPIPSKLPCSGSFACARSVAGM